MFQIGIRIIISRVIPNVWSVRWSPGFHFFCRSRIDFSYMSHNHCILCRCCLCRRVSRGVSLILGLNLFSANPSFVDSNFRRQENRSRKAIYLLSILHWGPHGHKKTTLFHSIPKWWVILKANCLSVCIVPVCPSGYWWALGRAWSSDFWADAACGRLPLQRVRMGKWPHSQLGFFPFSFLFHILISYSYFTFMFISSTNRIRSGLVIWASHKSKHDVRKWIASLVLTK